MKSRYYERYWQTAGIIKLIDPCYDNSVIALSAQSFPLSAEEKFDTGSTDKVSTELNRPNWCGSIKAKSVTCDPIESASSIVNDQVVFSLNWNRDLIATRSCRVTYSTEYVGKNWIGDAFDVEITDPCLVKELM